MQIEHTAVRSGRLSAILKEEMGLSTGLMNRLKWQDKLFVNGIAVHTDFPVQPGDRVTVPLDAPTPDYPAEAGALTVLYEDEHILAVDKPAGMLIHPSRSRLTGTLANLVLGYYQKTGQACAFHPITRLDRDTFGIVLLAKNAYIHHRLQQTALEKTYEALVFGAPAENSGTITHPIARLPLPSLLRQVDPAGKECLTEFLVLERFSVYSRLALRPVTGRTHQLRVHCAYEGYPILGDPQYANAPSAALSRQLGFSTQMLQAKSLCFSHPVTGETVQLSSRLALYEDSSI